MVYYSAVSMPSRADDSFLLKAEIRKVAEKNVSMPSRADDSFLRNEESGRKNWDIGVNALSGWWLISTFNEIYFIKLPDACVNALSGWWLISTYPFKNLGFMRFPEPIFAGICQNILTGPLFRACLQFGHI